MLVFFISYIHKRYINFFSGKIYRLPIGDEKYKIQYQKNLSISA